MLHPLKLSHIVFLGFFVTTSEIITHSRSNFIKSLDLRRIQLFPFVRIYIFTFAKNYTSETYTAHRKWENSSKTKNASTIIKPIQCMDGYAFLCCHHMKKLNKIKCTWCSGVAPSRALLASLSAPVRSKIRTHSSWPLLAERWRGVAPLPPVLAFLSPPALIKTLATSLCPPSAALRQTA